MPETGVEPATFGLGPHCSIQAELLGQLSFQVYKASLFKKL